MYKTYKYGDAIVGAFLENGSQRIAFTFDDPANTDYQAYLLWISEGHTPLPADEQGASQ